MATGWTAPPISKLPFLNIITEVLLMQVPVEKCQAMKYCLALYFCNNLTTKTFRED